MSHGYSASHALQATRDPGTAALLSVVPGLGQLYNGQSRKGILFLDVAFINLLLLGAIIFTDPLVRTLLTLGKSTHMKVNDHVIAALNQFHFGSMASLVVMAMILAFVGYAVRDAYDNAMVSKRRSIYADAVIDMPEATSGSYIMHFSLIASLAIMALFFCIPRPAERQMLEIQVLSQPERHLPPPKKPTNLRAKNSHEHGRHNPRQPINAQEPQQTRTTHSASRPSNNSAATNSARPAAAKPDASAPASRASQAGSAAQATVEPPRPSAPARSSVTNTTPRPVQPAAPPLPRFAPRPVAPLTPVALPPPALRPALASASLSTMPIHPVTPITVQSREAAVPLPAATNRTAATPASLLPSQISAPQFGKNVSAPALAAAPGSPNQHPGVLANGAFAHLGGPIGSLGTANQGSVPKVAPNGGRPGADSGYHGPAPVSATSGTPRGSSLGVPSPVPAGQGTREGSSRNGDSPAVNPGPVGPARGLHNSGPVDISPSIGSPAGVNSNPVNNARSTDNAPSSPAAVNEGPVNFGPYMAELQRRIRRHWFPPKHTESRRVVVRFKIHRHGELSGTQLVHSSGLSHVDAAALKAIDSASPFAPLPKGSPENVDIEFTFDYNVFGTSRF